MPSPRTMPFFRWPLPALTILAALLAAAPACYGQSAPQPQTAPQVAPGPPITAQTAAGDPPARVGRLAQMTGTVSFHTAEADQWSPASLNYPVKSGGAPCRERECTYVSISVVAVSLKKNTKH